MRKKFIAALMTVIMVFCFAPVISNATESSTIADETSLRNAIEKADSGDVIELGEAQITLSSTLSISKNITIKGGALIGSSTIAGNKNVIEVVSGANVAFEGVTVKTDAANKNAIVVYGATFAGNNLTIDHESNTGGAPVIVNNGSTATFTGNLNLKLGTNSWYGVNVDNASADFNKAVISVTGATGTKSVICAESLGTVNGVVLTEVTTAKHENADHKQVAYVADENLSQFIEAKTTGDNDVTEIVLKKDVNITAPLTLGEALAVKGNGYSINGTAALGAANVVTVTSDGVSISNIGIKTDAANKSALHVYMTSDTVLSNVTLDVSSSAGAGLIVNGSKVTIKGKTHFILGESSWGGINVDTRNGEASVIFDTDAAVTTEGSDKDVIYQDKEGQTHGKATITGAENAGLVKGEDGNYVLEKNQEPVVPGDEDKGEADKDKTDADKEDVPQTGDSSMEVIIPALIMLLCSALIATVTIRKKARK